MKTAAFMSLTPYKGHFDAPNLAQPFYFHVPAPYDYDTGDAIVSEQNVINVGGVLSGGGGRSLATVSWSGQFLVGGPDTPNGGYELMYGETGSLPSWVQPPPPGYIFDNAYASIALLKDMKENGEVATLLIRDTLMAASDDDVNMNVICKSFDVSNKEYEPDTRYYTITFQEYRPLTIRQVPRSGAPIPGTNARADKYGRFVHDPYTLPKKMSLYEICMAAYHKGGATTVKNLVTANGGPAWLKRLHNENKAEYVATGPLRGWHLSAGQKVKIPALNVPKPKKTKGKSTKVAGG